MKEDGVRDNLQIGGSDRGAGGKETHSIVIKVHGGDDGRGRVTNRDGNGVAMLGMGVHGMTKIFRWRARMRLVVQRSMEMD